MSRMSWLGRHGRPTGRHAAGGRGRPDTGHGPVPHPDGQPQDPAVAGTAVAGTGPAASLFSAPTLADARQEPLVSPVTDAARAAAAGLSASLPGYIPSGAAPLVTIDALGRKCPIPIILLAQQIRDVPVGSVIAVLADDPAAYSDIPAWCALKSHDCVFRADHATGWSFGVRRRY
jgi:tRNA 2-thiouridine synthesizing protein A